MFKKIIQGILHLLIHKVLSLVLHAIRACRDRLKHMNNRGKKGESNEDDSKTREM